MVVVGIWLLADAIDNPHHPTAALVGTCALVLAGVLLLVVIYARYGRPPARCAPETTIPVWGSILAAVVFAALSLAQIYLLAVDSTHRATSSVQAVAGGRLQQCRCA